MGHDEPATPKGMAVGVASKSKEEEGSFFEGLWHTVYTEATSFTTPRVVHVQSKTLSGLYWLINAGIWVSLRAFTAKPHTSRTF